MRTLGQYLTYSFRDKDPVIDKLKTIIADEGESYKRIHELSGVSRATLYQWFDGKTRRPQFASVMAVARALGYDLELTKRKRGERPTILRFAREPKSADARREARP